MPGHRVYFISHGFIENGHKEWIKVSLLYFISLYTREANDALVIMHFSNLNIVSNKSLSYIKHCSRKMTILWFCPEELCIKQKQLWKRNMCPGKIRKLLENTQFQLVEVSWIQNILDGILMEKYDQEQKYFCCAWRLLHFITYTFNPRKIHPEVICTSDKSKIRLFFVNFF